MFYKILLILLRTHNNVFLKQNLVSGVSNICYTCATCANCSGYIKLNTVYYQSITVTSVYSKTFYKTNIQCKLLPCGKFNIVVALFNIILNKKKQSFQDQVNLKKKKYRKFCLRTFRTVVLYNQIQVRHPTRETVLYCWNIKVERSGEDRCDA